MSKIIHVSCARMPFSIVRHGLHSIAEFDFHVFRDESGIEHAAMVYGQPENGCLLSVHSECLPGDVFRTAMCDCCAQRDAALQKMLINDSGIFIYLRGHEGRGSGLGNKVAAIALENERGCDTVEAYRLLGLPTDIRSYEAAASIVKDYFDLHSVKLLTNNPEKIKTFSDAGVQVKRVSTWQGVTPCNHVDLVAKVSKLGHIDDMPNIKDKADEHYQAIFFGSPNHPLSNFYLCNVEIAGRVYASVEHYYQAQKFIRHPHHYEAVALAPSPSAAKAYVRQHAGDARKDWQMVKEEIMLHGIIAKFTQHSGLRQFLLDTGNRPLIEISPDDPEWGVTQQGGRNRAGVVLARTREMLGR